MTRITASCAALNTQIEMAWVWVDPDENRTVWNILKQSADFSSLDRTIQASVNRMASDMQKYEKILNLLRVSATELDSLCICLESGVYVD